MNDEIIVQFKNVSKRFKLGQKLLLKEALLEILNFSSNDYFWALKDVSFNVKKGETLGIIGENGSGKSTILKLIAGVMVPTKGKVLVNGQIAPLIELGAGFHPELSGRENIYLNGTILGMKKKQIDHKFEDIVSFAELSEFVDTPVKHYSSGMYMRLGFSIAIHRDPDILLVDEILSVGDSFFQQKSYKKMEELKNSGVTIIYVSHSLRQIESFCDRVILLDSKNGLKTGDPSKMIELYKKLHS